MKIKNITKIKNIFLFFLLFIFSINYSFAENLKIGTIERKPFVIENNEKLTGFSINLWEEISKKLKIKYDYKKYEIFGEMLKSVENNNIDLAIANISITSSREKIMDFSHPIFDSGITLMTKKNPLYNYIDFMKSNSFIKIFTIFIIIYFLIFLLSKIKKNKFKNIYNILYIFILFIFIATIISNFTLERINYKNSFNYNLENLNNKKIGVIKSSTSEKFLAENNIKYISFDRLEDLYKKLNSDGIDGIMHDKPILEYYISKNNNLNLVGKIYKKEKYGILFPEDSPLKEKINLILLELKANGKYEKIYNKYFGEY